MPFKDLRSEFRGRLRGLWLGPAAAISLTGHISTDRADGIYLIDVGCELIYLVLMSLILGAWHA